MQRFINRTRNVGLTLCSVAAVALISGCAGPMALAGTSPSPAVRGMADGADDAPAAKAEQRVAGSPDHASARAETAPANPAAGRLKAVPPPSQESSCGEQGIRPRRE